MIEYELETDSGKSSTICDEFGNSLVVVDRDALGKIVGLIVYFYDAAFTQWTVYNSCGKKERVFKKEVLMDGMHKVTEWGASGELLSCEINNPSASPW
jgi:hypothetical protein